MRLRILHQPRHIRVHQLLRLPLRQREDVLRRVVLDVLEPVAAHADGVHEERREVHGHLRLRLGLFFFAADLAPFGFELVDLAADAGLGVR